VSLTATPKRAVPACVAVSDRVAALEALPSLVPSPLRSKPKLRAPTPPLEPDASSVSVSPVSGWAGLSVSAASSGLATVTTSLAVC